MSLKTKKRHARRIANTRRSMFERLEDRRVLAVWSVSADVPSQEAGSLEHAMEIALTNNEDDVIQLDAGTYHLGRNGAAGFQVSEQEHVLVLQGTGKDQTFIDAAGLQNRPFSVAKGARLQLSDLAVLNGHTEEYGGAVLNLGLFEANNVLFFANKADGGGAIANVGDMHLERTIVIGNEATVFGGGILNGLPNPYGGGVLYGLTYSQDTNATILDSAVLHNVVGRDVLHAGVFASGGVGGGLHNFESAEVHSTLFTGNQSDREGGAITNYGDLTLQRSNLTSNKARLGGGIDRIIATGTDPETHVIDSLVAENQATILGPDSYVTVASDAIEKEIDFVFTEEWQDGANVVTTETFLPELQSFEANEESQDNQLQLDVREGLTISAVSPGRSGSRVAAIEGSATLMYTPATNSDMTDLLVVTLSDQSTRWVLVDIADTNDLPIAIDDIYTAATWTPLYAGPFPLPVNRPTPFMMNVTANDTRGGDLYDIPRIVSFTQPSAGGQLKFLDHEMGEQSGDRWLSSTPFFRYSPPSNFTGTDSFTYVLDDGRGGTSEATVNVIVSKAGSLMNFSLVIRDRDGKPVRQVREGDEVTAEVWVETIPSEDGTPYSLGGADAVVFFPRDLFEPTGKVEFGDDFPNGRSGEVVPFSLWDEGNFVFTAHGGVSSDELVYRGLLARVNLTAKGTGNAIFQFRPELGIGNYVRGFHHRVPDDSITYKGIDVLISRSLHNATNRFDVNDDGVSSPMDALQIINALNAPQDTTNAAEAEAAGAGYLDVNDDGQITPMDALNVINHLNGSVAGGEGESSKLVSASAIVMVDHRSSGGSTDETQANESSSNNLGVSISQELFPSNGVHLGPDRSSEEDSRDSSIMTGHEELSDYMNDDLLTTLALSHISE